MAATAALVLEGVLFKSERPAGSSFAAAPPIDAGIALYHALASRFVIALLTEERSESVVEHKLKIEGLHAHAIVLQPLPTDARMTSPDLRALQITRLRNGGYDIEMMVDSDPSAVTAALRQGVIGLLFAHPEYQRAEFRVDDPHGLKAWEDLQRETIEQKVRRGSDPRRTADLG